MDVDGKKEEGRDEEKSLGMKRKVNKIKNRGTMGVCERMWGSKGSASWKVTVSSRRGVLYPIRVTLSCASLFRPSSSTYVTVTLLFSSPFYRFLAFPTIWPFSSACPRPPTFPPLFFFLPMGIRSLRGRGGSLPNRSSLPRSCAVQLPCPVSPPPPLAPSFLRDSFPSSLPWATYI